MKNWQYLTIMGALGIIIIGGLINNKMLNDR